MRLCGFRTVAEKNSALKKHIGIETTHNRIESLSFFVTCQVFSSKRQRHETKLLSPSWDRIIVRKWTSIPLDIYMFRSEHRSSCYKPPLYTLPTTTDTVAYIAILKRDEKYPTNFYHIFKTTTTLLSTVKVYLRFKSVLSHEIWKARSEGEFGLFQPISWWNPPKIRWMWKKRKEEREREWDLEDDSFLDEKQTSGKTSYFCSVG